MLLVNTYLGMSKIEGIGVFARHAIPAGTLIFKLDTRFDRLVPRDVYAALTGEPLPVEHASGDAVRSGALNAGGPFDLRATTSAVSDSMKGAR